MSLPAIEVSGLSKRYVIEHESKHDSLRDTLHHSARKLWRKLRWGTGFTREEFWALRDVNFTVQPGEVVGIIGRNGAGKSTLLKILSRITEPTNGQVKLRGRVASLLEVGTGFHPDLTGRENIFLNGAILGMSRAEIARKFDEIVAFAEIERFLDTPVKRYSSGMYVRLAFAVAAHLEPEILIVDEVLAVGDAQFQKKCLGKMQDVARESGRTVLFVSHNVGAVAQLCDRCLLLNRGSVEKDSSPEEAISAYLAVSETRIESNRLEFPRIEGDDRPRVQLRSVRFDDGLPLENRRPLRATFQVEVRPGTDRFGIGLGFASVEGRRVLTLESDYDGTLLEAGGAHTCEFSVELPILDLAPGRYRIDVGAFGPAHESLHYIGDCGVVEVCPSTSTPVHLHGLQGDWRPSATWRRK